MKKLVSYLLVIATICMFTSIVSAHLMEVGTSGAPVQVGDIEFFTEIHDESGVPIEQRKGAAEIYVMNSGTEDWVGFKFKIVGDTGVDISNVALVDVAISGGAMGDPVVEYFPTLSPVAHTYVIDNAAIGATIDFDFTSNVAVGEMLHFTLYTDNTTDGVNFGLCMLPTVPEPATLALLGLGGLAVLRRKK